MKTQHLKTIKQVVADVCCAYETPDSPEALSEAMNRLVYVRDVVLPECVSTGVNGGKVRSLKKTLACQNNAKKGGRPKKQIVEPAVIKKDQLTS